MATMKNKAKEVEPEVVELAVIGEDALGMLTRSEIEQQVATAKRYPRSITLFLRECTELATMTQEVAQECIYALPRGGKTIEGPSIRLAEILASCWGNCRSGSRIVNEERDFVTAQGVFHDMERNVHISYEVKRRITDKTGKRYNADMIGVTANAACSVALRNAITKGIPKAFWNEVYKAARKTIMGDIKTLANRRADLLTAFQKFGVTPELVCKKLGVAGVPDIGLEHFVTLQGVYTAIRDGEITPESAFAPEPTAEEQANAAAAANSETSAAGLKQRIEEEQRKLEERRKTAPIVEDPAAQEKLIQE